MRNVDLRLRKLEQATAQKRQVFLAHWRNFDRNAPCRTRVGDTYLESTPNESFESFTKRVVDAAITAGDHYLWLQNHGLSRNQVRCLAYGNAGGSRYNKSWLGARE
jgi:hypothetical protein